MTKQPALRIAFRQEGKWWNAYLARPQTMDRAICMGSILIRLAEDEAVREAFKAMMRAALEVAIRELGHKNPKWETRKAPEHEKSGHS